MDLQTLTNLFSTTYIPDPNVRKAGELHIRKIANEEGIVAAILQIIAAEDVDIATRQACVVWLKNTVHNAYSLDPSKARGPNQPVISNSDRIALRHAIIPLLVSSPNRSISVQLANIIKAVVSHDYPETWPEIVPAVKSLLTSGDVRRIHAGCIAAVECVRAFRFRQKAEILAPIISELFPVLVDIGARMLPSGSAPPTQADEVPTLLHLILKTYKTSMVINLSSHQQSPESLVPWGQLLFGVIQLSIPKEAVPEDVEERESCEWWKAKKWAYGILGRLFHRYGNPSQLPTALKKDYMAFAQHFVTMFAPEILNIYLRQVDLYVTGNAWLSKKCQYHIFQYFMECVKPKSTWNLLKPHFESLVTSFVFPHLTFNEAKKHLWENDPVDYLRVMIVDVESFASLVSSATSFLFSLASNRTKTTFMPILGIINSILRGSSAAPQRFGALNLTASLGPWIMNHPEVCGNMEQFVIQFVTVEFASTDGYMRSVACEVVGSMTKAGMKWSPDNLAHHARLVGTAMDDPELPVRVNAALAFTEMIVAHESVKAAVTPQVGKVIQDLLNLSDETDLDVLNHCMDIMVEQFQTELLPVSVQLTARLCATYMRLAKEVIIKDATDASGFDLDTIPSDYEDDKTYTTMGVAKTITTVVASIENAPEILGQIQEVIVPIILFTLENKILDLFDAMYELVDSLTYKLRTISPNMWPIFEQTYHLFKTVAADFLDEMLPTLDNFVSFGADVISLNPQYKQMLTEIYTISVTSDKLGQNDAINGSKLAESMLLNLRGNIDSFLQVIINTALGVLEAPVVKSLQLANLEVLINAVLYNPSAALHLIEAFRPDMPRLFFQKWFEAIQTADKNLPRVHDKKLSILALCALLELDLQLVPVMLHDDWTNIVSGTLQVFKGLPKAMENRKALETSLQEDSDEDEAGSPEPMLNMNEDDDDVWDADSAYLEMIVNEGARLREKAENPGQVEESEESDEELDVDEELGYLSPLDKVNPYMTFKQALTTFQMQYPQGYQAATASLNLEQQTQLMEVMLATETHAGG